MAKPINIVVPIAGGGASFKAAGYTFPKPLIDINGKPMIELVLEKLTPKVPHKFIIICLKEQYDKFSMHQIFNLATHGNFEVILLNSSTQGAASTVLTAIDHINNNNELIIANGDQIIDIAIDKFIKISRTSKSDGAILTFNSHHPRWSYARVNKKGLVLEVAEKKVISDKATAGIYYFKLGKDLVEGAFSMIEKNIRYNNDFYVAPIFNELILKDKKVISFDIKQSQMHGLGTPEDLQNYLRFLEQPKKITGILKIRKPLKKDKRIKG
jgi:dTDP-glucose pyrophosphorylase